MIVDQLLVYVKNEPEENNKDLCKEICCFGILTSLACTVFLLWFFHEINIEYYNSTIY